VNRSSSENDGRSMSRPSLQTTEVPTQKRVTTMPGDVQIGWLMYEYSPIVSTVSSWSAPSRAC
jgi:hypothetical protein